MPITSEHVGRRYPATEPYRVSRAKVAEFALAIGDASPAATAPVAQASPTFAMVIAAQAWWQLFDDPELGLALHRTVHADQRFDWVRPLREGDDVTAELVIDKVRNRGSLDMVTVTVDLATTEGQALCRATSTLWHTREEAADA